MNTLVEVWKKLTRKKYREAFVSSQLKRGIPFQVRSLRKQRGWSQADLAERAGVTQGVISRTEDPDYGNLTFNTVLRIAAGFDVAFIAKFVPFSELGRWFLDLSEESTQVASFTDESLEDIGDSKSDATIPEIILVNYRIQDWGRSSQLPSGAPRDEPALTPSPMDYAAKLWTNPRVNQADRTIEKTNILASQGTIHKQAYPPMAP